MNAQVYKYVFTKGPCQRKVKMKLKTSMSSINESVKYCLQMEQ